MIIRSDWIFGIDLEKLIHEEISINFSSIRPREYGDPKNPIITSTTEEHPTDWAVNDRWVYRGGEQLVSRIFVVDVLESTWF